MQHGTVRVSANDNLVELLGCYEAAFSTDGVSELLAGSRWLSANLACLQDCVREDPIFRRDAEKLRQRKAGGDDGGPVCCPSPARPAKGRRRVAA